MNDRLFELEVQKRVSFKMGEYYESLKNIKARMKMGEWYGKPDDVHIGAAIAIVEERFKKERDMGTIYDGDGLKSIVDEKNKVINTLADRLCDRGTTSYHSNLQFIVREVEKIYGI
jgi:hypothetical protein